MRKPMLAAKVKPHEIDKLVFPLVAQPKIDGYRGMLSDGKLYTRKGIRWPNEYIRDAIELAASEIGFTSGLLDGEIIVDGVGFNEGGGKMRKGDAKPVFRFVVFDAFGDLPTKRNGGLIIGGADSYRIRLVGAEQIAKWMKKAGAPVECIDSAMVLNERQLEIYESRVLALGYEGVCLRNLDGPYKQGRSTIREGYLTALKRFVDAEAEIVSTYEQMENTNEAGEHNTGGTKRSRKKEGLVPKGILGGVECRWPKGSPYFGKPNFSVATFKGMTLVDRERLWKVRDQLVGKKLTVMFQEHGMKEDGAPRIPVGKWIREEWDLS